MEGIAGRLPTCPITSFVSFPVIVVHLSQNIGYLYLFFMVGTETRVVYRGADVTKLD